MSIDINDDDDDPMACIVQHCACLHDQDELIFLDTFFILASRKISFHPNAKHIIPTYKMTV